MSCDVCSDQSRNLLKPGIVLLKVGISKKGADSGICLPHSRIACAFVFDMNKAGGLDGFITTELPRFFFLKFQGIDTRHLRNVNLVDFSLDCTLSKHKRTTMTQDGTKPHSIVGHTWSDQIDWVFASVLTFWTFSIYSRCVTGLQLYKRLCVVGFFLFCFVCLFALFFCFFCSA